MDLSQLHKQIDTQTGGKQTTLPPVESWDPAFCGDINMTIKRDGRWFYEGSPIGRAALVSLFSSVIKKENDQYFLVTPVEKVGIAVEDVPFVITGWEHNQGIFTLTTQSGDQFDLDANHPIELRQDPFSASGTTVPYVNVRRNLWGRFHQNVYYQLIERASYHTTDKTTQLRLSSGDYHFCLGEFEDE